MTRFTKLRNFLAAGGLLLLAASTCSAAGTLAIKIEVDTLPAVVVVDNGPGDFDGRVGVLLYLGGIGPFNVITEIAQSKPVINPPEVLLSTAVTSTDAGGSIKISVTDTDFVAGNGTGDALLFTSVGGTTDGTVYFEGFVDTNNNPFNTSGPSTGLKGPFFGTFGESAEVVYTQSGNFSLTNVVEIHHDAGDTTQIDARLNVTPEPDKPDGEGQLTPTGNECDDFISGNAADLVLTANPRNGNINPGRFFLYNLLMPTGDATVTVKTYSNPADAADPSFEGAKVFILLADGTCQNITQQPGVTVTSVGDDVTFFVPETYIAQSLGNSLVTRVEYKPPKGVAGTVFNFDTYLNGVLADEHSITVN